MDTKENIFFENKLEDITEEKAREILEELKEKL